VSEKDEQADNDEYVEEVRQKLPRYVTNLARSLALEALDDVDAEHPEARSYALARWFDAVVDKEKT